MASITRYQTNTSFLSPTAHLTVHFLFRHSSLLIYSVYSGKIRQSPAQPMATAFKRSTGTLTPETHRRPTGGVPERAGLLPGGVCPQGQALPPRTRSWGPAGPHSASDQPPQGVPAIQAWALQGGRSRSSRSPTLALGQHPTEGKTPSALSFRGSESCPPGTPSPGPREGHVCGPHRGVHFKVISVTFEKPGLLWDL